MTSGSDDVHRAPAAAAGGGTRSAEPTVNFSVGSAARAKLTETTPDPQINRTMTVAAATRRADGGAVVGRIDLPFCRQCTGDGGRPPADDAAGARYDGD